MQSSMSLDRACAKEPLLSDSAISTHHYMWQRDGNSKEKEREKELTILMHGGE